MSKFLVFGALAVLASFSAGCAGFTGKDEASAEFDKETSAADAQMFEDKTRTNMGTIESALADYVKSEKKIPERLDALVPKYLAAIPPLDLPACGRETDRIQTYSADILRDGSIDGTRIKGRGGWGYVFDANRVVIFVDCLKPSSKGLPWYQERGVY